MRGTNTRKTQARKSLAVIGTLALLLVVVAAASAAVGEVYLPLGEQVRFVLSGVGLSDAAELPAMHEQILRIRLPRILLGLVVGCALALSGGVMQGVFRNPLADPYLLGVSSGATAGAASAIALGFSGQSLPISLGALAGGFLAVSLVYGLSVTRLGKLSDYTLILSGIAIAALFGALTSFLIFIFSEGEELRQIIFWMLGSLDGASLDLELLSVMLLVLAGALLVQVFARDLNAHMLGDDMAAHLGVDPQLLKKILLLVCTLLTATVVSMAGVIGFVGLIVPHAIRLAFGPDHRLLLPAAGLAGATFLVLCDTASRTVLPYEVPVGIITALFGAPFLLYLLRRPRAKGSPQGSAGAHR
ncbi:MAG: iron ABC transporter permease [Planctomycetota bacterium]|nr:iron ABC transporter permease [Planctomycetota bacterium]